MSKYIFFYFMIISDNQKWGEKSYDQAFAFLV